MAAPPPPTEYQQYIAKVNTIYTTCLMAIWYYDFVVTFPAECHHFWRPKLSSTYRRQLRALGIKQSRTLSANPFNRDNLRYLSENAVKFLAPLGFGLVRYVPLVQFGFELWVFHGHVPTAQCKSVANLLVAGSALVSVGANLIMTLRCIALWIQDRKITIFLTLLFLGNTCVIFWAQTFNSVVPTTTACIPIATSKNLNAWYISTTVFDFIVVCLSALKGFKMQRDNGFLSRLPRVLIRDGILYLAGIFVCNLLAAAFELQTVNPAIQPINATLATVGTSIFATRITLHSCKKVNEARGLSGNNSTNCRSCGHGNHQHFGPAIAAGMGKEIHSDEVQLRDYPGARSADAFKKGGADISLPAKSKSGIVAHTHGRPGPRPETRGNGAGSGPAAGKNLGLPTLRPTNSISSYTSTAPFATTPVAVHEDGRSAHVYNYAHGAAHGYGGSYGSASGVGYDMRPSTGDSVKFSMGPDGKRQDSSGSIDGHEELDLEAGQQRGHAHTGTVPGNSNNNSNNNPAGTPPIRYTTERVTTVDEPPVQIITHGS